MFRGDDRAQAVQVGAILLFAVLVIALSAYQAFAVPQQNKEVEFSDYQVASGDLTDLRQAMLAAAGGSPVSSVTVRTGSQYPSRIFAVNPPPATGSLTTTAAADLTLTNVTATNGEEANTRVYWSGDEKDFSTRSVVFTPSYNVLQGTAPVVVSGESAYRSFDAAVIPEAGQTLVRENRITVVTIDGDLSAGGLSSAVTVEPVSAATRTVSVTGDGGEDINISLPLAPSVNATAWADSDLAANMRSNDRVKSVVVAGPNRVNVTLDGSRQYELRLAHLEVRETDDSPAVPEPGPKYVIATQGDHVSFPSNQSQRVAAEVRDRFNNPVSGVNVEFTAGSGGFDPSSPISTDGTGRASTVYDPAENGTHVINASFLGTDPLNSTDITVHASTPGGGGGGGGGDDGNTGTDELNPDRTGTISLQSQSGVTSNGEEVVTLTFNNNTDADSTIEMTEARISFFFNGDPGTGDDDPTYADMSSPAQGVTTSTRLNIGEDFVPLNQDIPMNEETTDVQLAFDEDIEEDDFYVISLRFSNGDTYTYFVSHPR